MKQFSIELEPADLSIALWWAVGILMLIELARYAAWGRAPSGRMSRIVIAALVAALLVFTFQLAELSSDHLWACVTLGALAVMWVLRGYTASSTVTATGTKLRRVLLAARVTAIAIVVVLLARPALQTVQIVRERAVLGILLDDSRSMTVKDVVEEGASAGAEPLSRLDAVRQALQREQSTISRISEDLELRWFGLSADVRERLSPAIAGDGAYTALTDSVTRVESMLQRGGRKTAGVIVVSDGRDTFSSSEAGSAGESLAAAGVPLYTVGVGSQEPTGHTRTLQARRLDVPQRVAMLNRLPVQGEFLAVGLAGELIEIQLLYDEKLVDQRQVTPVRGRELVKADLSHVPASGGLHRVTIRASTAGLPGVDAALSQLVEVTDDRIRVLYVDRPRYERAAISRALESAKELNVIRLEPSAGAANARDWALADWSACEVILLGDLAPANVPAEVLALFRQHVTIGRGLAILGGLRTLSSGAYLATPIGEVLRIGPSPSDAAPGPIPFELTAAGRVHPVCRLKDEPQANLITWEKLSPLVSASRLGTVPATAEVLVRAVSQEPLVVVQEVGKGRVAAIGFDATWQWAFASDEGAEAQRRFWRQLVFWLAHRRTQVWVTSERPRYELARLASGAEQVVLRAGVTEPIGTERSGTAIEGTITAPGEKALPITWTRKPEWFEARVPAGAVGDYHVHVAAKAQGQVVGEARTAFTVEAVDIEMVNPLADLDALRGMAARTSSLGGEYVPLTELGRLLDRLRGAGTISESRRVRRMRLVDEYPWWWLGALVLVLGVEWATRRRVGLV